MSKPITQLLDAVERGEAGAPDRLWSAVYDELHRLAQGQMAGSPAGRAIQPTTLVHEAYLRLVGDDRVHWANRKHFFGAAANAMRHILVDGARRRGRQKRGGGKQALSLDEAGAAQAQQVWGARAGDADGPRANRDELLMLDEALRELERTDPRKAEIVSLRFFAGLTGEQAAELMGLSPRTVDSEWRFARTWLYRELSK